MGRSRISKRGEVGTAHFSTTNAYDPRPGAFYILFVRRLRKLVIAADMTASVAFSEGNFVVEKPENLS